jgi:hypothetical protein
VFATSCAGVGVCLLPVNQRKNLSTRTPFQASNA